MRLESTADVTGTVLTDIHRGTLVDLATDCWWEQDATQGYASRLPEQRLTALRGVNDPVGFIGMRDAMHCAVWIHHEPEFSLDAIDFLWGAFATAHEILISPSLVADLCTPDQFQQTSYRLAVKDAASDLREALGRVIGAPAQVIDEPATLEHTNDDDPWTKDLAELKQLADLTNDQMADLFDVSRTSVQQWLAGGGMRASNREHLRQVLGIVRDAYQRLGSGQRLHELLMTPIGEQQKRPFEYLTEKRYAIGRGYLQPQQAAARHQVRRPIRPRFSRPEAERVESLEELNPSPRVVGDDE